MWVVKFMNPRVATSLNKLRTACIELLCTAMAWADFKTQNHSELRAKIISMFFKSLTSRTPEIVTVAKDGLRQVSQLICLYPYNVFWIPPILSSWKQSIFIYNISVTKCPLQLLCLSNLILLVDFCCNLLLQVIQSWKFGILFQRNGSLQLLFYWMNYQDYMPNILLYFGYGVQIIAFSSCLMGVSA